MASRVQELPRVDEKFTTNGMLRKELRTP